MKRERYSIIYSSKTGNTKKLAEAIYNTLPQNKCDYYGTVDKIDDVLSNVIYIGFWTEKGNAVAPRLWFCRLDCGEKAGIMKTTPKWARCQANAK